MAGLAEDISVSAANLPSKLMASICYQHVIKGVT